MAYRKLRGQLSGGVSDIETALALLKSSLEQQGWKLVTSYGPEPFGNNGPLHKINYQFHYEGGEKQ